MPFRFGQVAQLVEQRTENPCVDGSIPPLATKKINQLRMADKFKSRPLPQMTPQTIIRTVRD
jgi:hypothetical protein